MIRTLLPALAAALLTLPLGAQQRVTGDRDLDWRGRVATGGTVRVATFNGEVRVEPSGSDAIEVAGTARGSAAERGRIVFEVVEHGGGVTICARTERHRCDPTDGLQSVAGSRGRQSSGTARLVVRLPDGVALRASSGNGDVRVERAGGDVHASSGNGRVEVLGAGGAVRASSGNGAVTVDRAGGGVDASTGNGRVTVSTSQGPVRASSGNGAIDVRMASLRGSEDMTFSTGNGRVSVRLPASFTGTLDLGTGSGEAYSDFPVTVQGRLQARRLVGTVGDGDGPRVRVRSGNGSVEVRRVGEG